MNTIGFGTFRLKSELYELLPFAAENGYSLIDASDDYFNEEYVAGANTLDMKIMTKFSYANKALKFDEVFNKTEKLFTDNGKKIGCYLIHWPYPYIYKKIWRKIEDLYLSGRVSEIGVCNFTVKHLESLLSDCRVKPIYNEIELHPLFQQRGITEYCKKNGIKIISYSPFARMDKQLIEAPVILELSDKYNTSVLNIILKWNLQKGFIPIPSTSKVNHIKEMSLGILDSFELTNNEIELIDALECGKRVRFDPDNYFTFITKLKLRIISLIMR